MKIHAQMILIVALIIISASVEANSLSAFNNSLKTFESDGCTMFIDGTLAKPDLWRHCCVEHDMRYWFGGDQLDMNKTDLRLKACVKEVAGATWAELIYLGVRAGHRSPVKNKTQWSWGWNQPRANTPLNSFENDYVIEEVRRLPYDLETLEKFIDLNLNTKNAKI